MKTLIVGLATSLLAASPAFADVHLTMQDGRVSIVAKDATIRQILTEWARVGQTKIVNVERIPGGPVTLELNNVTEIKALDVLLRSLSGYIAAPRAVGGANLSSFDRIIIMPTLAADRPAVSASASPPSSSPPPAVFQQAAPFTAVAAPFPQAVEDRQDDEPPAAAPSGAMAVPGGAVAPQMDRSPVNRFSGAMEVMPQGVLPGRVGRGGTGQFPTADRNPRSPAAPFGGVAVPGMVAPPPPQPGQPGQPVRGPGGQ